MHQSIKSILSYILQFASDLPYPLLRSLACCINEVTE